MNQNPTSKQGRRRSSALPFLFLALIVALLHFTRVLHAGSYQQQHDNHVREIIVRTVHDGDTLTADVCFGSLGRTEFWAHNVRLRLKGVNCFEMNSEDQEQLQTAIIEREALARALQATDAQPLTAQLFRQTYDRYEAVIYTASQNVNELMLTYPQGGR